MEQANEKTSFRDLGTITRVNYNNNIECKDNKKPDLDELLFQMNINTKEENCPRFQKGTFATDNKMAEEQKRVALPEQSGQQFKIEDLEHWIEKNRKAKEEKRWSEYREQQTDQLERKRQENEACWVKKDDFDEVEERWTRIQKMVNQIERKGDELRRAEECKSAKDSKSWDYYRKQMDREEPKALQAEKVRRAEDKWWDKYKKQVKQKEEERARWREVAWRIGEDEVLAEFQELVQSKQAEAIIAEEKNTRAQAQHQYLQWQVEQKLERKKVQGSLTEQGRKIDDKRWADYRKQLIEQMEREEAKALKAEKVRRAEEDKYWAEVKKMVAQIETSRVMEARWAGVEEVLTEYEELVAGKKE